MKKNVWILNHYAGGMLFDKGGRHYSIAKYLKRVGYEPVIFCSNAKHSSEGGLFFENENLWHEHFAEEINVPFVFVKSRPYKGNGKTRVLNMMDYFINVQKAVKEYAELHGKPDVIIGSCVHPLACVAAILLSKAFCCKNIVEIRDLWPESIVAYNVASRNNPAIKLLYRLEKWIYTKANSIVFTMEGGKDYIRDKKWDTSNGGPIDISKIYHINNGVDIEDFDYNRDHFFFKDSDLDNTKVKKVIYTGSMREANRSITVLPDVADELLRKGRRDIQILMYGKGDYVERIKAICVGRHINNLIYKGFVQKKEIPYLLNRGDINVLNCDKSEMSKYGSSQNKLFEYLASGHPILSGEEDKYSIISNRNCGISKRFNNPAEIAEAIIELVDHSEKFQNIRNVGEEYDFDKLSRKLISVIEA